MLTKLVRSTLFIFLCTTLTSCSLQPVLINKIYDGDTFSTSTGQIIRLIQIDTPELSSSECYSEEAKKDLTEIVEMYMSKSEVKVLSPKTLVKTLQIKLEYDSTLDSKDEYGRHLSYLLLGDQNVNLEMVKRGSAVPYFYRGAKGKYAAELEDAAEFARENRLGIWGKCPGFIYNPTQAANTGSSSGLSQVVQNDLDEQIVVNGNANCSPHYRECVPQFPPDYDCGDLKSLGLIHVLNSDPHRLDRDGDGLACESNAR